MMSLWENTIEIIYSLLNDQNFCSIDVQGLSEGLVSRWNGNFDIINYVCLDVGSVLERRGKWLDQVFRIINFYARYNESNLFQNNLKRQQILFGDNVIVGRDLNLTLNAREIYGEVVQLDPLANYFTHIF